MPTLDDPHYRQHLLEKAELYLLRSQRPPDDPAPQLVRELATELALVDSLYTMLEAEYMRLKSHHRYLQTVLHEDLAQAHFTHRLYALIYTDEQIEEQHSASGT